MSLLNILRNIQTCEDGEDTRIWVASRCGSFSVSSFYSVLAARERCRSKLARNWRLKAPPKVVAFAWISLRRRILTIDNLRKRGKIIVNACPICLEDEENADHPLLQCRCAVKIWNSVLSQFGCSWVMPEGIQQLFEAWNSPIGNPKGKELWSLSFLSVFSPMAHLEGEKCEMF